MADLTSRSPNGWFNDWVAMAQLYPGYNGNANNGLNQTVAALSGGTDLNQSFPVGIDASNNLMLDGYMTYYGTGNVADNRLDVLSKAKLVTGGKTPWAISKDMGQNFRPLLTVYLNDASTAESTFNLLTDISSSGGTNNGQSMPVNVLTNAALQIGALLGARISSANPGAGIDPSTADLSQDQINALRNLRNSNFITGDVLLTPDGFGSFVKNYSTTYPIVNDSTSTVGSLPSSNYSATLSRTADGKGWIATVTDPTDKRYSDRTIPGSITINGLIYIVQDTLADNNGNLTPVLLDAAGKQYSDIADPSYNKLNLKSTDDVNAKQNLQDALKYLKSLQSTYEKYGVVFPDIFYASPSEFDNFCNTLPGFSPAPGIQLPGLGATTGNTVGDLLATQTYLAKLFAGRLNVSHVLNPWAVGNIDADPWYLDGRLFQDGSNLLKNAKTAADVRKALNGVASQVTTKATALGWFKASPYMNYLSIDKYERDEISGVVNNSEGGQKNAYNRNAWINYAYYGKVLSESLRTGPASSNAGVAVAGSGNTDLLYYQIPAASLPADLASGATGPFISGLTGTTGGTDLATKMATAGSDTPHYSFAFDSFFGNPDLSSSSNFEAKYPELSGLNLNAQTTTSLKDYLFSPAPNALEDAGTHDLTQGLLTISPEGAATVNRDIMGDVFGIIWGGGNTSTPLAYTPNQWGDPNATWTAGSSLNTAYGPNSQKIVPLGNTVNRLVQWAAANYSSSTGSNEVAVRSLGLNYAAIKTDDTGKLSLAVSAQAKNNNSVYLYRLSASSDTDAISGISLKGNDPSASTTQAFFQEISSSNSNLAVASGLSTSSAGRGSGKVINNITVTPNSYYGLLLVSQTGDGHTYTSSSYAAAGSWNGSVASDRGVSAAALVDSSQISSQFFGGTATFADARVLGFEDNILAGNTDFDYNDVFVGVIAGGNILI